MGEGNLKDLMEALTAATGRKKVRVGKVNPLYAKQLYEAKARHDAAHKVMEDKMKAYHDQLKKEHEPECQRFQEDHSALWETIYDEIGIPENERSERYSIDHATGVVEKYVDKDFEPFGGSQGPIQ